MAGKKTKSEMDRKRQVSRMLVLQDRFGKDLEGNEAVAWRALGANPLARASFMSDHYERRLEAFKKEHEADVKKNFATDSIVSITNRMWAPERDKLRTEEAKRRAKLLADATVPAVSGEKGGPRQRAASANVSDLVGGPHGAPFSGPGGTPFKVHSYDRLGVKDAGRMRVREASEEHARKLYELQERKRVEREQDAKARFIFRNWNVIRKAERDEARHAAALREHNRLLQERATESLEMANEAMRLQSSYSPLPQSKQAPVSSTPSPTYEDVGAAEDEEFNKNPKYKSIDDEVDAPFDPSVRK